MNNQLKSILYWLITILLLIALWPLIKWLIVILLIFLVYIYFKFKHSVKINTFNFNDEPLNYDDDKRNSDDSINDFDREDEIPTINDDIIDVEVKRVENGEDEE